MRSPVRTCVLSLLCLLTLLLLTPTTFAAEPKITRASFVDVDGRTIQTAKAGDRVFVDMDVAGLTHADVQTIVARFSVFHVATASGTASPAASCGGAPANVPEEHDVYPKAAPAANRESISVEPAVLADMYRLRVRIPFTVSTSVTTCAMRPGATRRVSFIGLRLGSKSWPGARTLTLRRPVALPIS